MTAFSRNDRRPLGGPKVKLAFVSGRYDSWGGFCGSSAWNQFHREEWGYGPAEYSWRLLDELGTRRKWGDVNNFGQYDFSAGEASRRRRGSSLPPMVRNRSSAQNHSPSAAIASSLSM